VLEIDALVQLAVADGTELERIAVSLADVIRAHHEALVVNAVHQAKHVTELVSTDLANAHQEGVLEVLFDAEALTGELRHVAANRLDTSICRDAVSKAVIAEALSEQIDIRQREHTNAVGLAHLNRADNFLQDVDSIELRLTEAVLLSVDSSVPLQHFIADPVEDNDLAWEVKGLAPLLELAKQVIGDLAALVVSDGLKVKRVE